MKKKLLFFLGCALLLALPCRAAEYNEELWRLNDYVELLTEDEQYELEDIAYGAVEELRFDFPICINDNYGEDTLEEFGEWFYERNAYGYGDNRDGVLLIVATDTGEAEVLGFGPRGEEIFGGETDSLRALVQEKLAASPYDAISDYITLVTDLVRAIGMREIPPVTIPLVTVPSEPVPSADVGAVEIPVQTREMPDWYPEDPASFVDFHDDSAPRVVDRADIFSDREERAFAAQLQALRDKHGVDFVLLTDDYTYDFPRDVYAADYYIYNGYGTGDDSSGMILFICMEPGYRGFWDGGTGSCESLFTGKNQDRLDDQLYDYMVDGEYAAGVENYFNNVDKLFSTGRVPRASGEYAKLGGIAGVIGLIVSAISQAFLRSGMKTVSVARSAESYLEPGSLKLTHSRDIFLHRSVTRTRRKTESRSGGGGGSSGHTSSSSGHSFSGGGRSF